MFGLSLRNPCIAGSGGVSCDRNGSWIRGYLDQRCFSWTARNGLQVAISLGISLLVNFDAQILLYMLISKVIKIPIRILKSYDFTIQYYENDSNLN